MSTEIRETETRAQSQNSNRVIEMNSRKIDSYYMMIKMRKKMKSQHHTMRRVNYYRLEFEEQNQLNMFRKRMRDNEYDEYKNYEAKVEAINYKD